MLGNSPGCVCKIGKKVVINIVVFFQIVLLASAGGEGTVDRNIKAIEGELSNYKGVLDFGVRLAANNLVREGDKCVDPVSVFITAKGQEADRRTIGLDILFRLESETSRAALLRLFSTNYVVLTSNLPSFSRLNTSTVVFEPAAAEEYNKFMFAYYIAREAVLRDENLAQQVVPLISEKDSVSKGLRDAATFLRTHEVHSIARLSLETNANYVVSILPFLRKVKGKIAGETILLEDFRRWYLSVLSSVTMDLTKFANIVSVIEQIDGDHLYEQGVLGKLLAENEKNGRRDRCKLLKTRKDRRDGH